MWAQINTDRSVKGPSNTVWKEKDIAIHQGHTYGPHTLGPKNNNRASFEKGESSTMFSNYNPVEKPDHHSYSTNITNGPLIGSFLSKKIGPSPIEQPISSLFYSGKSGIPLEASRSLLMESRVEAVGSKVLVPIQSPSEIVGGIRSLQVSSNLYLPFPFSFVLLSSLFLLALVRGSIATLVEPSSFGVIRIWMKILLIKMRLRI